MITSSRAFADYLEGVRRRTLGFFRTIPASRVDWAAAERMFTGAVCDGVWTYAGHERAKAPTLEAALADLEAAHGACAARLRLAMVAHEVHHRSRLASYLTWMGVEAPDIFGLGVEDVERLTAEAAGRSA